MNLFSINRFVPVLCILLLTTGYNVVAQSADSVRVYWLQPVEVTSTKMSIGDKNFPTEKDNLSNILGRWGFSLIRKGVFFAQDIYADGLKRGDINVVVDGERYHSACPNRMDSPLTRVNPLEIESVDLIKSSGNLQSGLGGAVSFSRSDPFSNFGIKASLSGTAGAQSCMDLAGMVDKSSNRLTFRYSSGSPYEEADGNTFKDLYGYKDNYNYTLAEAAFRGKASNLNYGLSFSYTDDVSFPYLMMDERVNRVISAFGEYKNNKLYFNYTDHVMDNALRISTMLMESAAKNLTIGVKGDFYDIYFRNWDINNYFDNPKTHIDNQMIPGVNTFAASVNHLLNYNKISLSSKIGLQHVAVTETDRMDFYEELYPDAQSSRWFPTFGLSANFNDMLSESWGYGLMAETVLDSPENEALYIAVTKPMANPNWSGNPTLSQPFRATLRGSVGSANINAEVFGSYIWNYVYLTKLPGNMKQFQTYTNINSLLAGVTIQGSWKYFDIDASYTWAENKTNNTPMVEIAPIKIMSTLKLPDYQGFTAFLRHTFNSEQTRIDVMLNESPTPSWNKFDAGVAYSFSSLILNLEVENITGQNYYQHLSYFRNPFSSSAKVYEPGRTVRLRILFNQTVFGG